MNGLDALRDALATHGYAHTPKLAPEAHIEALRRAFTLRLKHATEPLRRQHNARWESHQFSTDGAVVNPLLNPHTLVDYPEVSDAASALIASARLLECASAVLGAPAKLHQTAFYESSLGSTPHRDDHPHQADGAMVAVWIALETIVEASGPLVLWPGTHRKADPVLDTLGRAVWEKRHLQREDSRAEAEALSEHLTEVLATVQPVLATIPAGDAVWWDRRTVHGSRTPIVGQRRTRSSFIAHFIVAADRPAPKSAPDER
ncbi:MAG: phytanoyl-CoA dioxygenase family protein [Proteobacteria bacterium]|nr:phytanoyl-CoA dioxygenase family protein [Pseudomonadota bacterium]